MDLPIEHGYPSDAGFNKQAIHVKGMLILLILKSSTLPRNPVLLPF